MPAVPQDGKNDETLKNLLKKGLMACWFPDDLTMAVLCISLTLLQRSHTIGSKVLALTLFWDLNKMAV